MRKNEFTELVVTTLKENPQWMNDTILAIQIGMQERINLETELRANAEVCLSISYDKAKLLPEEDKRCRTALANSGLFKGTHYAEKLLSEGA